MTDRNSKKKAQLSIDTKPFALASSAQGSSRSITAALNAKPFIPASLASAAPSTGAALRIRMLVQ